MEQITITLCKRLYHVRIYTKLNALLRYRELSAEKITFYKVNVLSCDFKAYKRFIFYSRWENTHNQEYAYAIKFSSLCSLLPPSFISWHYCQSRRVPLPFVFFPLSMYLPAPINISSVPTIAWASSFNYSSNLRKYVQWDNLTYILWHTLAFKDHHVTVLRCHMYKTMHTNLCNHR